MRFAAAILGALLVAWPHEASAYRPFDGTDADVAAVHETEFELQTVGYYRAGSSRYFEPGGVVNYGLFPRVELVLQGFDFVPTGSESGLNRLTDTGLFAKSVWRAGCLQQKEGPSIATEVGPLLPTIHDARGWGAYAGGIVSMCVGNALIVHWNVEAQILRQTNDLDLFGGAILEPPPAEFVVRPVAELFVERDFGGVQTYSLLAGAIWRVAENLALDAALREAVIGGENVSELRAGFSLGLP
jgi:hypothetical protein